jgi:hypothetical protein
MASTYSALKIQLMATGENSGTWGNVTNVNLGTALEEAIVGSADVAFSSADVTLTLTDSNATQTARNLRLNLTGTVAATQNLIVPAIEKVYLVNNGLTFAITVKNTTGTGIAVPAGKTMWVYNNGTNVVDAVTHLTSLTLGSALPIASGGTGSTSTTYANLQSNVTGILPVANGGTGTNSTTYANLQSNVSGILPVANGGTGINSLGTNVATWLGTPSSANLAAAVTGETGSGALVFATSPTLVTPVLGTPSSGNLTSCTADGTSAVGYRNIPQSGSDKVTSYTLVTGDVGEFIGIGTSGSITIPNSTFAAGDVISLFNNTSGNITITCTITTAYIAGTDSDKATMTLATRGLATLLFISGTVVVVSGNVT